MESTTAVPTDPTPRPRDAFELQFLAPEFLSWLAYHADANGGIFEGIANAPKFTIQFGGKVQLGTPAGMVTKQAMQGPAPSLSADLRYAIAGGLSVREADLRLELGERVYAFALAADHFDLKRVKLPALLTEEEDDRADERVALLRELDGCVKVAYLHFLALRSAPTWQTEVVPAMRVWLDEGTRPTA